MRKFITLAFMLAFILIVKAQQIGEWHSYPAYHNATKSITVDGEIFVLSDKGLYSYNIEDKAITTYSKRQPLSDNSIFDFAYCSSSRQFVVLYENANIDLLSANGENVLNISEFKTKSLSNKDLNSLSIDGDCAYIATGFGVVELNIAREEFGNSYMLSENIKSAVSYNGSIYALADNGLYIGKKSSNLFNKSEWQHFEGVKFDKLFVYDGVVMAKDANGLYVLMSDGASRSVLNASLSFVSVDGTALICGNKSKLFIFSSTSKFSEYSLENQYVVYAERVGSTIWLTCGTSGLKGYEISDNLLKPSVSSIIPNSPIRNYAEYMTFKNGKLLVSGGGILLDRFSRPGTLMQYKDGEWFNFPENAKESTTYNYLDINIAAEDVSTQGHYFAASAGEGIYEFKNFEFYKLHNRYNSPLKSALNISGPHYTRVNGLKFDKDNNLWVLNALADTTIYILKPDGKWTSLYNKNYSQRECPEKLIFDSKGYVWATSKHKNGGILCLDYNGTIENSDDDNSRFLSSPFVNQDGTSYEPYFYNAIVEDLTGNIWFGTSEGLYYFTSAKEFLNGGSPRQVVVPRNDGTNTADYLLNGAYINDIAIDGANRKWVATNAGAYQISADGKQTLNHFTSANSPLPIDVVSSIAINGSTGEVFFGTAQGIVSYVDNASDASETLNESNVLVYPNPVKSNYSGLIAIKGLVADSNVKITSASGLLICEGTSNGGTFTWNGKDKTGRRVTSGVYYVLASDSEGTEGVVGKILIIN